MCVVRDGDSLRNLRLRLLGRVDHMLLTFHQRPLETLLGAVYIERLAVLASGVEQKAPNVGGNIRVLDLDVA